ncbi:phosphoenolpyruvate--protein phosphotransferase [Anaerocolumna jejuensis]|uniref:phosphoenolpyruvate--protein phosphotransferase n=1 Tax=Anaerocolumna jejuensis TaxID=259063 RepID=UPI003F7B68AE
MEKYIGKSVYSGIATGRIKILRKEVHNVVRSHIGDISSEKKRFEAAKQKAILQLKELHEKAVKEVGESSAAIFEIHQMMLEDMDYLDSIYNMIENQKVNAEYAVAVTGENFSSIFAMMDDEYMKERAADVKDVSERLINILDNSYNQEFLLEEPTIIVAEDLAPSETVQLDKEKVVAFVTVHGSINSHTAILARMMSIPALVNTRMEIKEEWNGLQAVVDGNSGEFIIEPTKDKQEEAAVQVERELKQKTLLQELKVKESVTVDGTKVNIYSNIGSLSDIGNVLRNDAEGIGLFRSEFIYLGRNTYPTEEEQFQIYKKAAEIMGGKPVVIRTLDIGADKQVDYFNMDKEDNPAMGYRAIRICLDRKEIFITQLRALFRASSFGNIAIMFPMIISVEEVIEIKSIVAKVKEELQIQGIKIGKVELGIMIETPAAVMISDLLAQEVDFFSIGTNDLTQYTLAIDRQNQKLDGFYNPHHLAVLRMIELVVQNAHKNGIWVGICGELGADMELTEQFLRMGIDELSVAPPFVLKLREKVRALNLKA